jgi:hypothetical protein
MLRAVDGLKGVHPRKLIALLFSTAFVMSVRFLLLTGHFQAPLAHLSPQTGPLPSLVPEVAEPSLPEAPLQLVPLGYAGTCGNDTHEATRRVWLNADRRYAHLRDAKFTSVLLPTAFQLD